MGDAGFARFHGCLDPRAEEFRPTYPYSYNQTPLFQPQIYYPYLLPPPLLPYSPLAPTAYLSPSAATPPLPPPLPPASTAATRTLLISSVPANVSESEVRRELEIFGDVRAVQMERVREGIVTVHFYDLRDAQAAAGEIREQHMQQQSRMRRHFDVVSAQNWGILVKSLVPPPLPPPAAPGLICGHAVWAQFIVPNATCVPDGYNQGTLVIFNLDTNFCTAKLKECFEAFGDVKELRETPMKRHQRFLEFYDIRNAAKAYLEMNGKEIDGNRIAIEFSRPGGHNKKHFSKGSQVQLGVSKNINFSTSSPGGQRNYCSQFSPFPRDNLGNSQGKKPSFGRGSSNVIGGARNEGEKCFQKRNCKKEKQVIFGNNNQQQQQQQLQQVMMHKSKGPFGSLKGRGSKCLDPRFLINEVGIMDSNINDSRTTVMIKNIPNKYSQKLLLNMLDNHCIHCNEQIAGGGGDDDQLSPLSSYDFVYLPIDFINKCNVGYGFVNMTSPQAAWRLYKAFHHQNWEVFNSKKICEVTYARLQGLETLKEHFRNSRFPCEAEEYLPVVFSPPRDGRQLSEPLPVVGRMTAASSKTSDDDESSDPAVLLLIGGDNDDDVCCINDENGGDGSSNGGDGQEAE